MCKHNRSNFSSFKLTWLTIIPPNTCNYIQLRACTNWLTNCIWVYNTCKRELASSGWYVMSHPRKGHLGAAAKRMDHDGYEQLSEGALNYQLREEENEEMNWPAGPLITADQTQQEKEAQKIWGAACVIGRQAVTQQKVHIRSHSMADNTHTGHTWHTQRARVRIITCMITRHPHDRLPLTAPGHPNSPSSNLGHPNSPSSNLGHSNSPSSNLALLRTHPQWHVSCTTRSDIP